MPLSQATRLLNPISPTYAAIGRLVRRHWPQPPSPYRNQTGGHPSAHTGPRRVSGISATVPRAPLSDEALGRQVTRLLEWVTPASSSHSSSCRSTKRSTRRTSSCRKRRRSRGGGGTRRRRRRVMSGGGWRRVWNRRGSGVNRASASASRVREERRVVLRGLTSVCGWTHSHSPHRRCRWCN